MSYEQCAHENAARDPLTLALRLRNSAPSSAVLSSTIRTLLPRHSFLSKALCASCCLRILVVRQSPTFRNSSDGFPSRRRLPGPPSGSSHDRPWASLGPKSRPRFRRGSIESYQAHGQIQPSVDVPMPSVRPTIAVLFAHRQTPGICGRFICSTD